MFGRPAPELKTDSQIRAMRRAGLVVADMHEAVREAIVPGVSTRDLDRVARKVLADRGATSNFLGYAEPPYPAVLCVSINDEVVHGIPGDTVIAAGDVVSIDAGAIVAGWHGDAAFTVIAGGAEAADPADVALSEATDGALWAGIAAMASGEYVNDIGAAIEDFVDSTGGGYGIVTEFTGHGIGRAMHMDPYVVNYRVKRKGAGRLVPGMCLAIEPMLTRGTAQTVIADDEWTVLTDDHSRAAHWEHTVALHRGGIWVLTAPDGGAARLADMGVQVAPLG